jgi:hypothetical protein
MWGRVFDPSAERSLALLDRVRFLGSATDSPGRTLLETLAYWLKTGRPGMIDYAWKDAWAPLLMSLAKHKKCPATKQYRRFVDPQLKRMNTTCGLRKTKSTQLPNLFRVHAFAGNQDLKAFPHAGRSDQMLQL